MARMPGRARERESGPEEVSSARRLAAGQLEWAETYLAAAAQVEHLERQFRQELEALHREAAALLARLGRPRVL